MAKPAMKQFKAMSAKYTDGSGGSSSKNRRRRGLHRPDIRITRRIHRIPIINISSTLIPRMHRNTQVLLSRIIRSIHPRVILLILRSSTRILARRRSNIPAYGDDATARIFAESERSAQYFQNLMNGYVKDANEELEKANKQVEEDLKSGKMSQQEYDAHKMMMAQNDQAHQMKMMGIANAGMQERQAIFSGYQQDLQNDQMKMAGLIPEKTVNGVNYYYDSGISKAASAQ